MTLEVRGYSERGMINALFYEMRYSRNGLCLLKDLLGLCSFPNAAEAPCLGEVSDAKVRIEQSFSTFGDLDVLVLLDGAPKQAVFIEAKVKTVQKNEWKVEKEWMTFRQILKKLEADPTIGAWKKPMPSNLFVQLYRKLRLVRRVSDRDSMPEPDLIDASFDLGQNTIVRDAAKELANYCKRSWFVAILPDSPERLKLFFTNQFNGFPPQANLPEWTPENINRWGYLTWEDIQKHCKNRQDEWPETLANFDYNYGQIFADPDLEQPDELPPGARNWVNADGIPETVLIIRRGRLNTRIRRRNGETPLVPNGELSPVA